MALKTRLT